jgi:hypothetical protein
MTKKDVSLHAVPDGILAVAPRGVVLIDMPQLDRLMLVALPNGAPEPDAPAAPAAPSPGLTALISWGNALRKRGGSNGGR